MRSRVPAQGREDGRKTRRGPARHPHGHAAVAADAAVRPARRATPRGDDGRHRAEQPRGRRRQRRLQGTGHRALQDLRQRHLQAEHPQGRQGLPERAQGRLQKRPLGPARLSAQLEEEPLPQEDPRLPCRRISQARASCLRPHALQHA